jgi:putative transposase
MSYEPMTQQSIWVQDFTYLWFERSWHYLAAVVQLKTRQIVGWKLGLRHSSELTHAALLDALSKHNPPSILHNDAGSEYLSYKHEQLCQQMNIILSCSNKGSPWENGFMERVFGTIKLELGPMGQYSDLGALYEGIALSIHYYNTKRIHSALKMSPNDYAASLSQVETVCL